MLYISFNDAPSGIYFGQVTDTCKYLKKDLKADVKLVAFISIRGFALNRSKIRYELPGSIVIPMVPKMRFWKLNLLMLLLISIVHRGETAVARGPYATWLALSLKKAGLLRRVVFDARGAYAAELNEYFVIPDKKIIREIRGLEARVLLHADFRMAVSEKLVEYWRREYGYQGINHMVIPCTLNSFFLQDLPSSERIEKLRLSHGFQSNEIVLVYSGSSAGWQSFSLVDDFLGSLMTRNLKVKLILMTNAVPGEFVKIMAFPERVILKWVKPREVPELLFACDYGLIIRAHSVTNEVAAPVKFAEYLSCGLKVLISGSIGDYSDFVRLNDCGLVIRGEDLALPIDIQEVSRAEKIKINELALTHFSKEVYKQSYSRLQT
jgi:hypothetical protein